VARGETETVCHLGSSNDAFSAFQKVKLKGPALLILPAPHLYTSLNKYFGSGVMGGLGCMANGMSKKHKLQLD